MQEYLFSIIHHTVVSDKFGCLKSNYCTHKNTEQKKKQKNKNKKHEYFVSRSREEA